MPKRMLDRRELVLREGVRVEWIEACQHDVDFYRWAVELCCDGEDDEELSVGPAFCNELDQGLDRLHSWIKDWPSGWDKIPADVKALFEAHRVMVAQFRSDLPKELRRSKKREREFIQRFGILVGGVAQPAPETLFETIGQRRERIKQERLNEEALLLELTCLHCCFDPERIKRIEGICCVCGGARKLKSGSLAMRRYLYAHQLMADGVQITFASAWSEACSRYSEEGVGIQ